MKQIITKINREKGFNYSVDREGNVIKESYNLLKDPYTLVTITILILGGLYYFQMSSMNTNEKNFENSCLTYIKLREYWISEHPNEIPTLEQVFSLKIDDSGQINNKESDYGNNTNNLQLSIYKD